MIFITSPILKKVNILPTRTELEFDHTQDCYVATALGSNLTSKTIESHVWGHFEIVTSKISVPVNSDETYGLKEALKKYLFGREVLCQRRHSHTSSHDQQGQFQAKQVQQ